MERVTGLEPANTSLGSSGLTTWRHPHQVSDYTLSIRKGVERFPEGSIFYVFPALKVDSASSMNLETSLPMQRFASPLAVAEMGPSAG